MLLLLKYGAYVIPLHHDYENIQFILKVVNRRQFNTHYLQRGILFLAKYLLNYILLTKTVITQIIVAT